MDEILYLEADEEITSVVDKLKGLETKSVGLVAPKGSTIVQSLVSLKLLKKEAKALGKEIAIITSDEVGQNLASRIDLPVYEDVRSKTPIKPTGQKDPEIKEPVEIDMEEGSKSDKAEKENQTKQSEEQEDVPENFEVHRYDEDAKQEEPITKQTELDKTESQLAEESPESTVSQLQDQTKIETQAPHEEIKQTEGEDKFVTRPVAKMSHDIDRHELEAARPISQGYNSNPIKKGKKSKAGYIFAAGFVFFLLILLAADLTIAKLNIKLTVPAEAITKDVAVQVEKDRPVVDLEQSIIPGVQVSKENDFEQTIQSTGEKDAGTAAKGTLTFKNDSGVDETINSGTTVRSSNGIDFILDSSITVPKASLNSAGDKVLGQATGSVTAKDVGSSGNLSNSTTYAISSKPKISVSGGTNGGVTKKVKVVSRSDIENAKNKLKDAAKEELSKPTDDQKDYVYLSDAGTVEISDFSSDKSVGDEADSFKAKAHGKFTSLIYKSDDLKQAITKSVEKGLTNNQNLLPSDTDEIQTTIKENNINIGKMTLANSFKSHVGPKLDLGNLQKSWRLKPIKKIKDSLASVENVQIDDISLSPNFALPVGPIMKSHIIVKIDYTKK
ncbi:MAG: baseplate J/gp47 family protein [Candidatus Berkelbacteria bacterium]|nr:baseplate J/gp47 family protein [Candidatus Berkelbacteria bacterium]